MDGRILSKCIGVILSLLGPSALADEIEPRITLVLKAESVLKEGTIWPGFSLFARPVILYETGKRAWVIGHPAPPSDCIPLSSTRYNACRLEGPLAGMAVSWHLDFPLNGSTCFAMSYQDSDNPMRDIQTLVHEYFHFFQRSWISPAEYHSEYPMDDPENIALAVLEQRALARALLAPNPRQTGEWARMFVAIRKHRIELSGGKTQNVEDREERSEGTADYVENRTVLSPILQGDGENAIIRGTADRLKENLSQKDMGKHRGYFTGSAQCILLDRMNYPFWKKETADGTPIFTIMAKAFPVSPRESGPLLRKAKSELCGYESLLDDYRQSFTRQEEEKTNALKKYESTPGIHLTVMSFQGRSYTSLASSGGVLLLEKGRKLHPDVNEYKDQSDTNKYRLVIRARAMLEDNGYQCFISERSKVWLDGQPSQWEAGEFKFTSVKITEPGFELEAIIPGVFKYDGKALTISWTNTEEGK